MVPGFVICVLFPIDIPWGAVDILEIIIDISPWFIIDIFQAATNITVVLPAVFWSCGTLDPVGNVPRVSQWEGNSVYIAPKRFLTHQHEYTVLISDVNCVALEYHRAPIFCQLA